MSEHRRYPDLLQQLFAHPLDPGYAEAATRRAEQGPRRPWARRGVYVMKLVAVAVFGFLLSVAYNEAVAAEPDRSRAHAGLVQEIKSAQDRTDELHARSEQLRREVTAAEQAALGASAEELARVRQREATVGLGAVAGGGAVVELADAPVPIDPQTGRPTGDEVNRVLDVDLQSVVNGLWATGAEAVAVNGQRLTAVSTIRAAGSAILVDFRPVTSPYEVSAVGPGDLERRFDDSAPAGAMRELATRYGLGFSVRGEENLTLPAAPSRSLRYAYPVD